MWFGGGGGRERKIVSVSVSVTLNPTGLGYSLCSPAPVVNGSETDLQSVSFKSDFLVFFFFYFTYGLMILFLKWRKLIAFVSSRGITLNNPS